MQINFNLSKWKTILPRGIKIMQKNWLLLSITFLLLLTGFAGCGAITTHLVKRADQHALRNPDTGLLIGAEERDLGDANSSCGVLLVHGFIGGGNNFADLPERLAQRGWHVRVMRLPGHGTSPLDFEKQTPDELIQAVRNEISQMKKQHDTVAVVGHSMGCALSAIAISETPVDKLVLGAPYFSITYRWPLVLKVETWTTLLQPIIRWVYKGKHFMQVNRKEARDKILSYAWVPTKGAKTLIRLGDQARQDDVLENIHCPVLMIHAHGDRAASHKAALKAYKKLASQEKQFHWLERSNHQIFWDYESEEVMDAIETFLGMPQ